MTSKVGRNDPCPCGSGRKYKRCCGDAASTGELAPPVRHDERHTDRGAHAAAAADGAAAVTFRFAPGVRAPTAVDDDDDPVRLGAEPVEVDLDPEPLGDLSEAESSLLVHLEFYERLGHQDGVAAAYANLGLLYEALGDPEPARAMYEESLTLHEALGRDDAIAAVCSHLARLLDAGGDPTGAAALYERSIASCRRIGAIAQADALRARLARLPAAGLPTSPRR